MVPRLLRSYCCQDLIVFTIPLLSRPTCSNHYIVVKIPLLPPPSVSTIHCHESNYLTAEVIRKWIGLDSKLRSYQQNSQPFRGCISKKNIYVFRIFFPMTGRLGETHCCPDRTVFTIPLWSRQQFGHDPTSSFWFCHVSTVVGGTR